MTDTIKNFPNRLHRMTQVFYREVPSQVAARRFVDSLANLLFPVRDRRGMSLKEMDLRWENLQQDFLHIITPLCSGMDCCCERLTARFFAEIPLIYAGLMKDANLYKSCDPAAYCTEEVILCYPGFYAVMIYRLSHVMHRLNIPWYMTGIIFASLIVMIICVIVNLKWKLSEHMAGAGAIIGGLVAFSALFGYNPVGWLCIFILVAGVLGTARIILQHHTLGEVMGGFAVGLICTLLVLHPLSKLLFRLFSIFLF